jgi:hypothetical protein
MGLTTLPQELDLAGTVARVCGPVFGRSPYRERLDPGKLAARAKRPTLTDLVRLIIEGGLDLVELRAGEQTRRHASGAEVVDFIESSSFGNLLGMVPEDLRDSLRADLAAAFEACRTGGNAHERQGEDGDGGVGPIAVRQYGALLVARRPA